MSTNGKTLKFRAARLKGFTVFFIYAILLPPQQDSGVERSYRPIIHENITY